MYSEEEIRKIKHDFKRPFSNLQMLVTILKGSDMDKARVIENLEKIIKEGQAAVELLDKK
ncbi:MAG: hypothetical protein H0V66_04080 [Bdellovibrionales bacterium]|nr:hypothetical protein [Bdellovibrionales bacterium]